MNKGLFIILIILTSIIACKSGKKVNVGMAGCYTLSSNEKETPVSKELLNLYNTKLKIDKTQSYINRLVIDNESKKFFGFVLKDIKDIIINKIKQDSTIDIIEEKTITANENDYDYFKVKEKSGLLIVKVILKQEILSNSIVMDAVFDNEDSWNNFYNNTEDFTTRLNCKNEKK